MNPKEIVVVKKRSRMKLSIVDGDLRIKKGATIIAKEGTIVVNGKVKNKGGFKCKGNLEARSVESDKGSIIIYGDLKVDREASADKKLIVHGNVEAESLSAGMTVSVDGKCKAESVSAGMTVKLKGEVDVESVSAGMKAEIQGNGKVGKISAGMRANVYGTIEGGKVSAGMKAVLIGGSFEKASVGMSLITKNDIKIEKASAGMKLKFKGNAIVESASAGMTVKASKNLTFDKISAGFKIKAGGELSGESASAGFGIIGNSNVEIRSSASAGFKLKAANNIIGGKISTGRKIIAKHIKAKQVQVGKRGRIIGIVEADRVILLPRVCASNIYATELEMQEKSKAKNVFADHIIVESGARLSGKIQYTGSFDAEDGAKIRGKPEKVKALPSPK